MSQQKHNRLRQHRSLVRWSCGSSPCIAVAERGGICISHAARSSETLQTLAENQSHNLFVAGHRSLAAGFECLPRADLAAEQIERWHGRISAVSEGIEESSWKKLEVRLKVKKPLVLPWPK